MTSIPPTPPTLRAICIAHYGRIVTRAGRQLLIDNNCDRCPLRTPCLKHGGNPARTMEELAESKRVFVEEALAVVGCAPP